MSKDKEPTPDVFPAPPLPRGVADPAAGTAYVSEPAGTLAALDLTDGSPRWRAATEGMPMAAGLGWVFVVAAGGADAPGVLHLRVIDAANGAIIARRSAELGVVTPELSLADLDLSARVTPDGLELGWRYLGEYQGGAPPSREMAERFSRQGAGAFRYSPRTDVLETIAGAPPPRPALESFPYRRRGRWLEEAWDAGGVIVRLVSGRGPEAVLELETWTREAARERAQGAGGEPSAHAVVWRGEDVEPSVTGAGGHLFLRRTQPPGRSWQAFTVPGGEQAGDVPFAEGDQWPEVLDGRVYHLALASGGGLTLRAVELASGRHIWDRNLAAAPSRQPSPPPPRS